MSKSDEKSSGRWIGFDLGGTKMMATVFDSDFQIVGKKRKRTQGQQGAEAGIERIVETIHQAIKDSDVKADDIQGIGVGCPGPVDLRHGIVLEAVNLGWNQVPLQKALEKEFGCPAAVLNDVDAGVYGENELGAGRGARTLLGIFPGTGIGGGCVYDGQIICGENRSCMEIGHVEVTSGGNLCGCGRRGCLETEASRLAISAEIAKAAYRGETKFLVEKVGTNLTDIRSGVLAAAIEAGDEVVEQIVRKAAGMIGIAVANFVHLLCPDKIVLGGGMVEALPELFVETVTETARQRVMPSYVESFQVVAAELGDYATAMGAAAWVRKSTEKS
jgi:glucokinase